MMNRRMAGGMRRNVRGVGGLGGPIVPPTPIALLSPYEDWQSTTGLTFASTKVSNWRGTVRSLDLAQATAITQPGYTAINASCGNAPTVDCAISCELNSTLAASAWAWMHDGTIGATIYTVYYQAATASNDNFFGTCNSNVGPGVFVDVYGTAPHSNFGNGTTNKQAVANGTYAVGKRWLAGRFGTGVNPLLEARSSVSSAWVTSATAVAATAAAPSHTLRLGPVQGAVSFARAIIFNRVVSDADHLTIAAQLAVEYGAF